MTSSGRGEAALSIRSLAKTYGSVRVVGPVDLDIARGSVHCLLGGNGSGKSTLIKVLAGIVAADPGGTVASGGTTHALDAQTPSTARSLGLHFVHQDPGIFLDMSIADNIAADAPYPRRLLGVHRRQLLKDAHEAMERFDLNLDPRRHMSSISASHRTLVAIARALRLADEQSESVLVLDEPTASLPGDEVEDLLGVLRRLADQGQSIVYVTHHLDEVVAIADECTVLRDGTVAARLDRSGIDRGTLVQAIVGREITAPVVGGPERSETAMRLEVREVTTDHIGPVSLEGRAGEVVGIAGILGSGRSSLLRAIFGATQLKGGQVLLDGAATSVSSPADALTQGIALVPEDRPGEGVFLDQSIGENVYAGVHAAASRIHISPRKVKRAGTAAITSCGVKATSSAQLVARLSGGNQQKVVIARALRDSPRLLLLDEPTQGVDIGARGELHQLILQHCRTTGATALVVSSSDEELATLCDRVLVMREGRVSQEIQGNLTSQTIARAVLDGHKLLAEGSTL